MTSLTALLQLQDRERSVNGVSVDDSLSVLDAAVAGGMISGPAAANMRPWLTEPWYEAFAPDVKAHLACGKWAELEEAFWTVVPFGTAGRRGPMYPIGTAAINDRTIGESVQGLADFVRRRAGPSAPLNCAIAYDTRHRSRHFAELSCEVMAAAGFKVLFLDGFRATPELSLLVRDRRCDCGIMISASHNPPSDNAIKVFGASGGQLRPPDDAELMRCVELVSHVQRKPFGAAVQAGQIALCGQEIDDRFRDAVLAHAFAGPRNVSILYSPLHGVGLTSVVPVLHADGFKQVEIFEQHAEPNGDFPNVPGGIANPENPAVFSQIIARAEQIGADLALASDPDADRIGCAAPLTPGGPWQVLSGNQIGALLADYILRRRSAEGTLTPRHYVVKTLVTSEMIRRIADLHGVTTIGDVPTGFKWISSNVDERGPEHFVFGCEEAYGYMVGDYIRDKDAAAAAMLLAELAAELRSHGLTLHQELERLYAVVGYHEERSFSVALPGADGQRAMREIMQRLRSEPPPSLAGMAVRQIRDYGLGLVRSDAAGVQPLPGARTELVCFDFAPSGNYIAVRPSGTEPKLKCYLFAYRAPDPLSNLNAIRTEIGRQLDEMDADLRQAMQL